MKRMLALAMGLVGISTSLPAVSVGDPLSYEAALDAIIARSPDVESQKVTLAQVQDKNLPDRLALLPTVSLVGERSESQITGPYLDPNFGFTTQTFKTDRLGGAAQLGLNLFHFGSDLAAMHAASTEERAQTLVVTDETLRTEGTGARALNAVIQAEKEVGILQRLLDGHRDILQIARERFRRGLFAQQEVDKVAVDLANDEAQLRDAESESIRARADLIRLLGTDNIQLEWPWTARLRKDKPAILKLTENSLAQRPDWQSAEARVKAARERQSESLGQMLPSLDLSFSYGYFHTNSDGTNYNGPELKGAVQLTIPLFDRLVGYSTYETKIRAVSLAELDLEKITRQARADWETAKGALEIALQTAKARDQTLEVSRKLYEDNLLRFQRGLVSANDLNVDQARLFQSERLAVEGWSAAHTSFVTLCNALGKRVADCWQY